MSNDRDDHAHTNRLIDATSPYLLQHAHNPVDWYPWGEEALERAKKEGKLILLSIGYSACHWCHVMEHESFEDPAIAGLMNDNFINIKVDREERPDLDEIYMMATVSMNRGQGGWPMTVFLTPELEPVFAGTYFPPTDMHGRPGFPTVLREVARAWREDPEGLRLRAAEFAEHLRGGQRLGPPLAVGEVELRKALDAYKRDFDSRHGGFGSAPKFPPAVGIQLLVRLHRRFGDPDAVAMVRRTLEGMARGGIYDHVGGGFARYSTDSRWLVPHFEKMLYDNALLAKAYLEGHQVTGEPSFRRVATDTLDYVLREMTSPEGGFYSSTDADSEGVEGKFYVWTPEQIAEVLDEEEARCFNAYYDITLTGNWEGVSIPNTPRPLETVADELGMAPEELRETLESARAKVYEARLRRVKPGLDDKALTAWNGLMIGALAEGYRVLGDVRYLEAAERAAAFILEELTETGGGLLRSYREGKAHLQGYLEDYAYFSESLLDLYEADGSVRWLREAERLLKRTLSDFVDEKSGAFYNTAGDHEQLMMRYRDGADGATPAANAVAASSLARLSYHLDRSDLRRAAAQALKAHGQMIERYPRGFARSLCVVDFLLEGPVELAFVGAPDAVDTQALRSAVAECFLPNRIVAHLDPDADGDTAELPLLQGKSTVNGAAALYVCRDFTCEAPITDPGQVADALAPEAITPDQPRSSIALRIPGRATSEGTARYASRQNVTGFNTLGRAGLTTSRLGFGGYRTHDNDPQHREALRAALTSGVNLVDTSTNYLDGASERLIGGVLQELIEADRLSRDEVIVVTKIGYAQGTAQQLAREREARGEPFPQIVKIDDRLWHCIHPAFLEDQLQRSLDRLELETVDLLLLHNPEYFLTDAAAGGADDIETLREEFYRRLGDAFAFLEEKVAAGRVGGYGISSNTLTAPAQQKDAISLSRVLDAARSATGSDDHHSLLAVQIPLNLLEPDPVFNRKEGPNGDRTVLELAGEEQVAVLVNRPLNAFVGGKLVRLADAQPDAPQVDFEEQLGRLADLEFTFQTELAPQLQAAPDSLDPAEYFKLAERFKEMRPSITGIAHWAQIEGQVTLAVMAVVSALNRQLEGTIRDRWIEWRDSYLGELEELMRELRRQAAEKTQARNATFTARIDPLIPGEWRNENLARKALWIVASTPCVSCVLNGMRSEGYVKDALTVMDWPKLDGVAEIYEEMARPVERGES